MPLWQGFGTKQSLAPSRKGTPLTKGDVNMTTVATIFMVIGIAWVTDKVITFVESISR